MKFLEFVNLKEENTTSEVKLDKPFVVNNEYHPNLDPIVKAFQDSNKINLPGPSTIEKKGETKPKLKKKTLYLTGGAVRDHLLGKTPRDYDLATDATPD